MAKRRFSVADSSAPAHRMTSGKPVRHVAPKVPRAADICIATSRTRSARKSLRQSTRARSGGPASRGPLPQKRLGELPRASETPFTQASRKARAMPSRSAGAQNSVDAPAASTGQREFAKLSVLDMLRLSGRPQVAMQGRLERSDEHPNSVARSGAQSPAATEEKPTTATPDATWLKTAVLAVTSSIDAGRASLAGGPWVRPAELTRRAEDLRAQKRGGGADALSPEDIRSLVLQPSVFVWAPDLLFQGLKLACPECGCRFSEARWHSRAKPLHAVSALHAYIAREYTCYRCTPDGSQARRRRKVFLADTPALLRRCQTVRNRFGSFTARGERCAMLPSSTSFEPWRQGPAGLRSQTA